MSKGPVVSKFGGSSVKDAPSMLLCADIVKKVKVPTIVVISATWNTSNLLEDISRSSVKGDSDYIKEQFKILKNRHDQIARDLKIYEMIKVELESLYEEALGYSKELMRREELSKRIMDSLYSIGERLSSLLFTNCLKDYLGNDFNPICFDIREALKTDSDYSRANPNMERTKELVIEKILPLLTGKNVIVTQGFIGSDLEGNTTTLGREGSDYTGAILSKIISASEYFIWTDVNGVKRCDPKLVDFSETITELSYDDAEIMASLGAKVLFPRTMEPVKEQGIPIFVGSTRDPSGAGSWIKKEISKTSSVVGFAMQNDGVPLISVVGHDLKDVDLSKHFKELKLKEKDSRYLTYEMHGEINYGELYRHLFES